MFKKPQPKTKLQMEIDKLVLALKDHKPGSQEYGTIVERLSKLHKIQEELKPESISPNTALTVAANIFVAGMIVHHERLYSITSKAMGFVKRV